MNLKSLEIFTYYTNKEYEKIMVNNYNTFHFYSNL
jgi:hypothetical protein